MFSQRPIFVQASAIQLDTEWHRVPFPAQTQLAQPHVIADVAQASAFGVRFHALGSTGVSIGLEDMQGKLVVEPGHSAILSVVAFGAEGPLSAHPLPCPDKCGYDGERGYCEKSKCICESGWSGLTCKVPAALCPNQCSNNGACTAAGCRCKLGWVGEDCSTPAQHVRVQLLSFTGVGAFMGAKVAACEDNCSGHGVCIKGVCSCTDPDWYGWKCHIPNPCIRQCSGHGKCIAEQGCECAGGWGGLACDQPALMCPYDYDCGDGKCVDGKCVCDSQHFGFNCARLISDANRFASNVEEPQLESWQRHHH
eukprot:c7700_g1_i2.p1 GENE.c7700_g1_i2~~c7700_g1_i2.p1  ORF type:complete len:309 (+),score=64.33 c7700_g1_i2:2-928(+)